MCVRLVLLISFAAAGIEFFYAPLFFAVVVVVVIATGVFVLPATFITAPCPVIS